MVASIKASLAAFISGDWENSAELPGCEEDMDQKSCTKMTAVTLAPPPEKQKHGLRSWRQDSQKGKERKGKHYRARLCNWNEIDSRPSHTLCGRKVRCTNQCVLSWELHPFLALMNTWYSWNPTYFYQSWLWWNLWCLAGIIPNTKTEAVPGAHRILLPSAP